jgi:RNA polymerase sigma factor (sigma-70 family)
MSATRIELYAFDQRGRKIEATKRNADVRCHSCGVKQANCPNGAPGTRCCADCWHPQVMKVRARADPGVDISSPDPVRAEIEQERAEQAHKQAKREAALATLTPEERAVFELRKERVSRKQTREVPREDLERALDQGWQLDHQENGMAIVTREVFMRPSYDQVAKQLGLTARQVHRRIASANEKLRRAR